jgi:branched-chain amino acid transport system substrate-binding protein
MRAFRVCFAVSFFALLAGCANGPGQSSSTSDKIGPNEIGIGVAGPMSGQFAVFGEQLRRGAEAAIEEINAKGGVLGKQLHLVVGDDQCDRYKAVNIANRFVRDGVSFVDGHFCSGASIPASAVYADAGILQMTPASTNPFLTDDAAGKGIRTVFRVTNRDDEQGDFAGSWIARHYAGRKLAVLDDRSSYGSGVANRTVAAAKAAGMTPALVDNFAEDTHDFSGLIQSLKAQDIAVVYVGGYHVEVAPLVRQARDQGFRGDFVSDDALNTAEFWSISGPAGEGVRFSDAASSMHLDSAKEAVAKLRSQNYEPEGYTLNAYAAVQVFAAAADATGSTDGKKLGEWLRHNQVHTVIGDLNWDDKGDLVKPRFAWFVWHDGRYAEDTAD